MADLGPLALYASNLFRDFAHCEVSRSPLVSWSLVSERFRLSNTSFERKKYSCPGKRHLSLLERIARTRLAVYQSHLDSSREVLIRRRELRIFLHFFGGSLSASRCVECAMRNRMMSYTVSLFGFASWELPWYHGSSCFERGAHSWGHYNILHT
jgi:hypothetical protein